MTDQGGRPTDYSEEIYDKFLEYMNEAIPQNMTIPTVEGLAIKLAVTKKTLYNWAKKHKKFLHALSFLKMRQKQYLTEIGIFGGKEINATIVQLLLKVNHKMIETTKTDVTSGGKPIPILGNVVHTDNSNNQAPEADQED